jgi:hypothetical protein
LGGKRTVNIVREDTNHFREKEQFGKFNRTYLRGLLSPKVAKSDIFLVKTLVSESVFQQLREGEKQVVSKGDSAV